MLYYDELEYYRYSLFINCWNGNNINKLIKSIMVKCFIKECVEKIKIFLNKIYIIFVWFVCLDIKYLIFKIDLIRFRIFIRRVVWFIGLLLKIRFIL